MADTAPSLEAKEDTNRFIFLMVLVTSLTILVFAHQVTGYGTLSTPGVLIQELRGDPSVEPLDDPWPMGEEAPYVYRPLFRFLVLTAYATVEHTPEGFYGLFLTASAICLLLALLACDWFFRELGFSDRQALLGMALFGLGFPVLFAYDFPVHTREDLLGYLWIALTLIAVARDKPWAVAALGVVGAMIRETCLIGVLPYFFVSQRGRQQVLMAYAIPGIAWLTVRAVNYVPDGPSFWETVVGSTQPLREYPLEALLYLFATFGCLWVAAGLRLADRTRTATHPLLGTRVVLVALAATATTGWVLGQVRENRITYILFPFVIGLALEFFGSERFKRVLRSPVAWAAALAVLVLGIVALAALANDPDQVYFMRRWFNVNFHFGVAPVELQQLPGGEEAWVEAAWASPFNGPFVIAHLAASAFLLAGALATRKAPEAT